MLLYVIFIQRDEEYEGQIGVEAVDIMDEYSYEDNPDYLNDKLKELQNQPDITKAELIPIEIKEAEITKILFPAKIIKGDIKHEKE